MTKEIANWSDEAMFRAEPISSATGPKVTMIAGPADPLGMIAYFAKAYVGKFPGDLEDISDTDREYYIQDILKNVLGSPLETVQFSFHISGVTRGFTHQLVRQRVGAAYQQESMRFAVKEDFPVALPESIRNVKTIDQRAEAFCKQMGWWKSDGDFGLMDDNLWATALETVTKHKTPLEEQRDLWDNAVDAVGSAYRDLVAKGMPAEEARGLAPTNILTQVNYTSSPRGLLDHAGMRLCEQAQHEWKIVWAEMLKAMRAYGITQHYRTKDFSSIHAGAVYGEAGDSDGDLAYEVDSSWQYNAIADMFKPVCFQAGKCKFMSDFDRHCTIRDQVQAFHENGVPSTEWEDGRPDLGIPAIRREQWMAHGGAIRKTGDWRTPEQQANIRDRR